jgi:hypothetical protein
LPLTGRLRTARASLTQLQPRTDTRPNRSATPRSHARNADALEFDVSTLTWSRRRLRLPHLHWEDPNENPWLPDFPIFHYEGPASPLLADTPQALSVGVVAQSVKSWASGSRTLGALPGCGFPIVLLDPTTSQPNPVYMLSGTLRARCYKGTPLTTTRASPPSEPSRSQVLFVGPRVLPCTSPSTSDAAGLKLPSDKYRAPHRSPKIEQGQPGNRGYRTDHALGRRTPVGLLAMMFPSTFAPSELAARILP